MNNRFDEKAKEFDSNPVIKEIALNFSKTLKKNVPLLKNTRLLDFGCGSGLVGMHLYKEVEAITMMDSSKGMLNILRDKIKKNNITNMIVINSNIHEFTNVSEKFDVVYMSNVLHHIEHTKEFITKISNIIKPNGNLCIGDLKKENGTFHDNNKDVKHFGFEEIELSKIFKKCGLNNIKYEEYYVIKKPDKSGLIHNYPFFFMTAIKA